MSSITTEPLFSGFPPATDADWRKAAEESLEGASFEKKLITRTSEGVDLQPIYSRANGDSLGDDDAWPGLPPYVRGSDALGSRASGWYICQKLGCTRVEEFNAALRFDLDRGQNAVVLPLDTATRWGLNPEDASPMRGPDGGLSLATVDDIDAALHGVDLAAVPLFTSAGVAALPFAALLISWLTKQGKSAPASMEGYSEIRWESGCTAGNFPSASTQRSTIWPHTLLGSSASKWGSARLEWMLALGPMLAVMRCKNSRSGSRQEWRICVRIASVVWTSMSPLRAFCSRMPLAPVSSSRSPNCGRRVCSGPARCRRLEAVPTRSAWSAMGGQPDGTRRSSTRT
jgi:hypothetical protein